MCVTRHCAQALCPDERVCDVAEKAVAGLPAPPRHTDGTVPEPEPAGPFCVQGRGWSPQPLRTTTSSVFQGPLVPSAQQRAHSFPGMTWRPLQVGTLSRAEAGILERDRPLPHGRGVPTARCSGQASFVGGSHQGGPGRAGALTVRVLLSRLAP